MRVNEVEFKGYKAFYGDDGDTQFQRLKLAPLTLVLGKNNSGKSAAVRLPRLLLGGMECDDGRVLPIQVRGLSYGSNFLDLVHGGAFFGRPAFRIFAEHQGQALDFTATLYSRGALAADEPPRIWSYQMGAPETISIADPPADRHKALSFAGLLPPEPKWDEWRKAAGGVLDEMVHLGPTRKAVEPTYQNEQFAGFGLSGSGAPQLLRLEGALADDVESWYATNMEGWRLSLKRDSEIFSLRLSRSSKLSTNLAQGGEGLQQVLPVVIHQLWRQRNTSSAFLDVVEQPELHLHAAAQAPIADLLIDTALQAHGQTLVETNSEPILLRVQRRIAEGKLRPDRVALYFVEMTDDGSQLRPVGLNPDGEVEWWPHGVFEEDFSEVAAIRRAQRARTPPPGAGMRFVLSVTALNGDEEVLNLIDRLVDRVADEVHRVEVPDADLLHASRWYECARPTRRKVLTKAVAVPPRRDTSSHGPHAKQIEVRHVDDARVADKLAHAPLTILVEDREADGVLLEILVEELGSPELRLLWAQGQSVTPRAFEIVTAGSIGAMKQRVQRAVADAEREGRPVRLFVLCDSDARWPGDNNHPSGSTVNTLRADCSQRSIALHVFQKRNAENYIPDAVIEAVRDDPQNTGRAHCFDALLRRTPKQRDHFPLKDGLSDDERAEALQAGLYEVDEVPDLDLLRMRLFPKRPRPLKRLNDERRAEFTDPGLSARDGKGEINTHSSMPSPERCRTPWLNRRNSLPRLRHKSFTLLTFSSEPRRDGFAYLAFRENLSGNARILSTSLTRSRVNIRLEPCFSGVRSLFRAVGRISVLSLCLNTRVKPGLCWTGNSG